MVEAVEHQPPILVGRGIRTLVESNQLLLKLYLQLPSQALGIFLRRFILPVLDKSE